MAKARKERLPSLEDRFEFHDGLRPANTAALQPALFPVFDRRAGVDRALRLWRKTGGPADEDLRELWLHERRQVQRLLASAHSGEVFVGIIEFVEDEHEFGALLEDAGRPLSRFLATATGTHWLRNLGASRPREILWRNFTRLVQAVEAFHKQGLVHGALSAEAVFTHGAQEPDFRLGGFEWSLWFAAPPFRSSHPPMSNAGSLRPEAYSFAADWRALGMMFADLLGVRPAGNDFEPNGTRGLAELSPPERVLLRQLIMPGRTEASDAGSMMRAIDNIAAEAARAGAARAGTLILMVPEAVGLGIVVSRATSGGIDQDDRDSWMRWASADLKAGATLFVHEANADRSQRLALLTSELAYALRAFTEHSGEASWDVSVCYAVSRRDDGKASVPRGGGVDLHQEVQLVPGPRQATELRARLGRSALDWSLMAGSPRQAGTASASETIQSLVLVQLLEAYVASLEVLPVEIIDRQDEPGRHVVVLRARPDSERDEMARQIGLSRTADALRSVFEEDGAEPTSEWFLGVNPGLGGRGRDIAARFRGVALVQGLLGYRFELDDRPVLDAPAFLRSPRDAGAEGVIRRRLTNVAALTDQPSVAEMLVDPWQVRRSYQDALQEDDEFLVLDQPKQEALRQIYKVGPTFLVVGPPGVGKTHLATEVIRRRFTQEPASRLLITAQGHDALDNLEAGLFSALDTSGPAVLLFRPPRPQEADDAPGWDDGDADLPSADQAQPVRDMLDALAGSELAARLPQPFRRRLDDLAAAARSGAASGPLPSGMRRAVRAMAALVEDAANVVVATVNSPTVGRLVEERDHFDSVLVEEAAKVTGPEIAGALALSGNSLLIGDHKQLPPFNSRTLESLLSSESLLRTVLNEAEARVGVLFREGELERLERAMSSPAAFERIRGLGLRLVQPFRTFVMDDERRARAGQTRTRMSVVLTEQRRMHPAIAEVVSRTFYDGLLTTSPDRVRQVSESAPPVSVLPPLPASPLVVVDFEHVSLSGKAQPAERSDPRWHNPDEVDAVVNVLRLVRAAPSAAEPPTLAVLSPYRAQVDAIKERLNRERPHGGLEHLAGFRAVRAKLGLVGTVDSFQGSEADIVIVSLVRNNAKVGRGALGFLRDERRMNVLLSRAKWKLVVVGSLRFLKEAVRGVRPEGDPGELGFILRALASIDDLRRRETTGGQPDAAVIRPSDLVGRS